MLTTNGQILSFTLKVKQTKCEEKLCSTHDQNAGVYKKQV